MADLQKTTLKITGMSCAACANRVEKAVSSLPGVRSIDRLNDRIGKWQLFVVLIIVSGYLVIYPASKEWLIFGALVASGCSSSKSQPQQQGHAMNMGDMAKLMNDKPDEMVKMMSSQDTRKSMTKIMSSQQMQPAMMDMMHSPEMQKSMVNIMSAKETRADMVKMMSDPAMRQPMIEIMTDPAMKDTFMAMMQDQRIKSMMGQGTK